ncbi:MAG TPA: aldehyde dehydrogenase family protein [Bacteriovoracaceae bacterium]|nr:aldehyde dehydrogenase family protein [Bacteriovoracaceae bacterium]
MKDIKLFIDGEFITSNHTVDSINPATGEAIARIHLPTNELIDTAVEAAHKAFYQSEWKNFDKNQRADILLKIAEKIKERKDELIEWEIKDSGSVLRKAKADIHNAASYFKVLAGQCRAFEFEVKDERASRDGFSHNYRTYLPVGVCAQIIPWNFPLVMAAWKIGPVIASGSTAVLKTALETPITASILAEILSDSGLPPGVINIITGDADVGQQLIAHPKIRKIAFTGSTQVGKSIMEKASQRIQNISLELGGKSANIILKDADLNLAVDGALYAFLYHQGQACDSGTRLLVDESIYPQFKEALVKRIKDIKIGEPHDPNVGFGPVINSKQSKTIMNYIQSSLREGGNLLYGGRKLEDAPFNKGEFIEPTLIEVDRNNIIFKEEIFGPVLAITTFRTEEEAIDLANDSIYGLAGAVWSKDLSRAKNIASRLETGTVWINEYHLLNPGMPFGGFKQSGLGREMGEEGMKAYLEVQHLWISDCNEREKKVWFDALF